MAKSWSSQETGYLKRYAANKTLEELAQRFELEPDEVRAKLRELELVTRDGEPGGGADSGPDPMVGPFEDGLKALYAGKWDKAAKLFAAVVAESDQADLAARARQHLEMARRHGEESGGGEDPYLRAVFAKNQGELGRALEIVEAQKKDDGGRFTYLAASIHALREHPEDAAKALAKATEADPRHKVSAYHDPDFTELRKDKDYAHLFGLE